MDIERNDNVIMITCDFSRYSVNRITSTAAAFPISTSFFTSASMLHANASEKRIVLWFCVGQNKNGDKLSKKNCVFPQFINYYSNVINHIGRWATSLHRERRQKSDADTDRESLSLSHTHAHSAHYLSSYGQNGISVEILRFQLTRALRICVGRNPIVCTITHNCQTPSNRSLP